MTSQPKSLTYQPQKCDTIFLLLLWYILAARVTCPLEISKTLVKSFYYIVKPQLSHVAKLVDIKTTCFVLD